MPKRRSYSIEEFLELKPIRKEFEWFEEEGKVRIKVPKFKSKVGKTFCKIMNRDTTFIASLDEKGSLIWKLCDGKHKVGDILREMEKNFPDEKDLDQRLFLYLYNLKRLEYISY